MSRKLNYEAYTVGWISTLPCELNAARALLDEEHERLPSPPKDDNVYLLGRMEEHNVAIVILGPCGPCSASQAVTNLVRTFPSIRFGLLVGVGGGAPKPPHSSNPRMDIRLGDVVVSEPEDGQGCLLNYEAGVYENGGLVIRNHLNKPSKLLMQGTGIVKSDHMFRRGKMQEYIDQIASLADDMEEWELYKYPGRYHDQLFKSDCPHSGGDDCRSCDTEHGLEKRLDRRSDSPVVHYGCIASGSSVIRSAQYRDRLRDAWGVCCFEMEMAGIMDDLPSAVIRGICDYSDSHKNKTWQPYAAVTAAAYAKDLLRVITPENVSSQTETIADECHTKPAYGLSLLQFTPTLHGGHYAVSRLLHSRGINMSFAHDHLVKAASIGNIAMVNLLLAIGSFDLDRRGTDGSTPLAAAVAGGHRATVESLLRAGANPNIEFGGDRMTPLFLAILKGDEGIVDLLTSTKQIDLTSLKSEVLPIANDPNLELD
ncbi:nucleoside phosphorylase domain-containing protein [Aspergillus avenaceus]|uniref:Nucleoside phosphorylase domain-containing protein n=1 Tax=Aspergillus avenaceus TaxID=36643 RepID=A0A5N6U9K9_ASPAV|nr:nucleoside phosphorylase domain-containing protein [Aspergillus avenaceus]